MDICTLAKQQGSYYNKYIFYRILASAWFMFAMIVIASYTANLAAFLTVETLEKPISSAEDLERQDVIKYGVVNGGSTAKFFQTSANPVYQRMGEFMNSK